MSNLKLDAVISVVDNFSTQLGKFSKGIAGLEPAFTSMRNYGTAAFVGITGALALAVSAYGEAERAQRQLESAVIGVSKGTMDQVQAVSDLTDALQAKVGIDGDALKTGAAQLSTFGLQSESVVNLTKSLADYTVNQAGVNAASNDYIASAGVIAKALKGQFGALEKSQVYFTEAQQSIILYGTESEKVAALQEGLAQNLRETTDTLGGVDVATARATRSLGEIAEALGGAFALSANAAMDSLVPILNSISDWIIANPELAQTLVIVAAGIAASTAALGTLGIAIPAIIKGIKEVNIALKLLAANPITWTIAAIIAIMALFALAWKNDWGDIREKTKKIVDDIVGFVTNMKDQIMGKINGLLAELGLNWNDIALAARYTWEFIKSVIVLALDIILATVKLVWDLIGGTIQAALDIISGIVKVFVGIFKGDWSLVWEGVKEIFMGALDFLWNIITSWLDLILSIFDVTWEGVKSACSDALDWVKNAFSVALDVILKATEISLRILVGLFTFGLSEVAVYVYKHWETIKGLFTGGTNSVLETVKNFMSNIASKIADGAKSVISSVTTMLGNVKQSFLDFVTQASEWGLHLIQNFADGILQGVVGPLTDAVNTASNFVKDKLGFSVNPYLPSEEWGEHMIGNFADGMAVAQPKLSAAVQQIIDVLNGVDESQKLVVSDGIKGLDELNDAYTTAFSDLEGKISGFQESLDSIFGEFSDTQSKERKKVAEAIVASETDVADLKAQIADESDAKKRQELKKKLEMELSTMNDLKDRIAQFDAEVTEVKRVNGLTQLQLAFENYDAEIAKATILRDTKLDALNKEVGATFTAYETLKGLQADRAAKIKELLGVEWTSTDNLQKKMAEAQTQVTNFLKDLQSLSKTSSGISVKVTSSVGSTSKVKLASGGIVTNPTNALIGEGGEPEAVIPLSKAGLLGFGGGNGGGINITIHTNGYVDKRGFERLIDDVLMPKLKRNLTLA